MATISNWFNRTGSGFWQSILRNSGFLIVNSFGSTALGFLFWLVVARTADTAQVGIGAAYITSITFLANVGQLGLGVAVIRFAKAMHWRQSQFINTCLSIVASITILSALAFAFGTSIWLPELTILSQINGQLLLFVAASLAFSIGQFLDRVFIAYETTQLMFARTMAANLLRVVLIIPLVYWFGATGFPVAVGIGALISIAVSFIFFMPRILPGYQFRLEIEWNLVYDKLLYSISNLVSIVLWTAPQTIYPLIIVKLLGAEANAHFYISWMLANLLFVIPTSISTSTFARSVSDPDQYAKKFWQTMWLTVGGLVPIVIVMAGSSKLLLSVFGQAYVEAGRPLLILFLLSAFPYAVNTFFIVHHRIQKNIRSVILLSGSVTIACFLLIVISVNQYKLSGVGIGWVAGQAIGVLFANLSYRFNWK